MLRGISVSITKRTVACAGSIAALQFGAYCSDSVRSTLNASTAYRACVGPGLACGEAIASRRESPDRVRAQVKADRIRRCTSSSTCLLYRRGCYRDDDLTAHDASCAGWPSGCEWNWRDSRERSAPWTSRCWKRGRRSRCRLPRAPMLRAVLEAARGALVRTCEFDASAHRRLQRPTS